MFTENRPYRDYEIQVMNRPPIWQAAIYPTKPGMTEVDWTTKPIEAANVEAAYLLARRRIDYVLSSSTQPSAATK
jgi:hypothetical protein